ncbi:MAG: nucleoside monophosphate kinase [bacterium]|nr:nucleoside monophosphate kinase [bacterium]
MRDLILFGVQGCGKGTQSRILAERGGYKVFETGKELRALTADASSELGQKIKGIIEVGNLVSDEVVIEIVENFLQNIPAEQQVIFDGLPRKVTQKDLFEEVVARHGRQPLGVLIQISDELALQRLSGRHMSKATGKIYPSKEAALLECPAEDVYQRADDTPDAIKTRLKNYHTETQPVIDWYQQQGRLVEVRGDQATEAVTEELINRISHG